MSCCYMKCKNVKFISIFSLIILLFLIIIFIIVINNNLEINKDILVVVAREGDNQQIGNAIINFSENKIIEGTAISHTINSSEIMINEPGIYQISYQLTGTEQGTGRFNFNSILLVNNLPDEDTRNSGAVLSDDIVNNRYTLTSTVILQLNAGDILQLGGISLEEINYTNARIDIEKIG